MKLAYFNDFRLGVVRDSGIVDVTDALKDIPRVQPQDLMRGLIERFAEFRPKLEKAAAEGKAVPLSDVRIRPPLPRCPTLLLLSYQPPLRPKKPGLAT